MYWIVSLLLLALDQFTKWLVQTKMLPYQNINLIKGWFSLTFVKNYGAAFSIFYGQTGLLIVISILVFGIVWFHRHQIPGFSVLFQWGLALALGGAAGNFLDRIRLGFVVDFFYFHYWPVFNIADAGIVVGVALITMALAIEEYRKRTAPGHDSPSEQSGDSLGEGEKQ